MDYYTKYLKYKSKYLELQRQSGGKCKNNICKLQDAKFDNNFIKNNETEFKKLKPEQINKMIELKTAPNNFSDEYSYEGAKLDDTTRDKMKELKNVHKFTEEYAYEGAKLKPEQIKNMIELKTKTTTLLRPFSDEFAYKGATLDDTTREMMIKLKSNNQHIFDSIYSYKFAKLIIKSQNKINLDEILNLLNERKYDNSEELFYEKYRSTYRDYFGDDSTDNIENKYLK